MIDPGAALPIHFSLETTMLAGAGLVVAWSAIRRNWIAAGAAAALLVVHGLHAGQFIADEDHPALIVIRLAGVAALGAFVVPRDPRRVLLGGALGAIALGAIWGALDGGGARDLALFPHLLIAAGAIALMVWVWQGARASVRLRVIAAFVSVLAVVVVVAGGAVARVAAVDARNETFNKLGLESATILRYVVTTRNNLIRRAATLSPELAASTAAGSPAVDRSRVLAGEWLIVTDRQGQQRTSVAAENAQGRALTGDLSALDLVRTVLAGTQSHATLVQGDFLEVVAAAPVYRPGSSNTPADVVGAVIVGQAFDAAELKDLIADPRVDVAVADSAGTITTNADLATSVESERLSRRLELRSLDGDERSWLATIAGVPEPSTARLVVAVTDAVVVDAATDLVRAFLVAILAAALLAIVAALWLSARITRPMLQLADDAERVKRDFLASVSHELRTPLTPIRGYTEILRSRPVPKRAADGYLDEIGTAAQRLERIVALLLDVAAIEAGRFQVLIDEVSTSDLLEQAAERWKDRSGRKIDLKLTKNIEAVKADPGAIARVLDELIDNAVKFAPDGDVELLARRVGDGIEISVHDEGPGIDPERLKAIREKFHQEESGDTRRFGGLGLGLTFIEGVLAAHGASLDIKTTPGRGTTCSFALPAVGSVGPMSPQAKVRKRSSAR